MNQKTNEFRKKIADNFVKVLSEDPLHWKMGWVSSTPVNAYTGKRYKGINRLNLKILAGEKRNPDGYIDNRWATFKQIQEKGWKLKKGSKGVQVEYWMPYDLEEKKALTWNEFREWKAKGKKVSVIAKYYVVFNGNDIEGIPKEQELSRVVNTDELVNKISAGMQVPIINDGGGESYYNITNDTIHLPTRERFFSSYEYNATALHELSHASGAAKRLNREMHNGFGTEKYAYEELVAEISSCFMGEHMEIVETEEHMENHKAYVQSWIKRIQEKPETLVNAIRDAEAAANYLEYHAGILTREEYLGTMIDSMEVSEKLVMEEKEIAKEPGTKTTVEKEAKLSKEMRKYGLKPSKQLMRDIGKYNELTGKEHSFKEIYSACSADKEKPGSHPDADRCLKSIRKGILQQEAVADLVAVR